ncbi:hypothetical protein QLL95_gp0872 [Cotonvirus japonicus]|uniref:Uncharacterized protein n=1 Tax=Cotonvirus japonicus TaxID=2811091 RepID=A0ABM7NT25_9VIRU|nr:hypothetical protein QLL95_gp0872 [Cotonvirus japonicus]BCS83251.1 hypothetical protein [Cotonvirus japonicus]
MTIIAHIIGMDEILKKKLCEKLLNNIIFIDLDNIQQEIYNCPKIKKYKIKWSKISQKIINENKNSASSEIIKKLHKKRNTCKQQILFCWKDGMNKIIEQKIIDYGTNKIIFIGFNIFPKDYRTKINLNLPKTNNLLPNKIIYDITSTKYSQNQIKHYLKIYNKKIIKGTFPINLLKTEYLENKHKKFISHYTKQGYKFVTKNDLITTINLLIEYFEIPKITYEHLYVATIYKSTISIIADSKMPLQGFPTRQEAIDFIRGKIKSCVPIYIYIVASNDFKIIDNNFITFTTQYPINEESMLLTM